MNEPRYDERLSVPLRWWVQGVMFLVTVWIAVILWVPEGLAWAITATPGSRPRTEVLLAKFF